MVRNFKLSSLQLKKKFIKNRLIEISKDLKLVEERLQKFRNSNRSIFESPALLMEQERLIREVGVQNEVYITLKQQLEMSKIELFDNTNMLEVLDEPEFPLGDSRTKLHIVVILSIILAIIISSTYIIAKDWYDLALKRK